MLRIYCFFKDERLNKTNFTWNNIRTDPTSFLYGLRKITGYGKNVKNF